MNYRHAYHAGNFADVVKHWVFALTIDYLKRKRAPFRDDRLHLGLRGFEALLLLGCGLWLRRRPRQRRAAERLRHAELVLPVLLAHERYLDQRWMKSASTAT